MVRMNRAIAVGRADDPATGLELLRALADEPELARHHPYHVALALFHAEVDDDEAAAAAWRRALTLADNSGHRRFIQARLAPRG